MEGMDMGLLTLFVVLTIINVILNTARTIITVKGGMFWSSFISALAFGFYVAVIVWTMCDLPLWVKVAVTALANFIGTYFVKYIEMKMRKDRLWLVDVVLTGPQIYAAKSYLDGWQIQYIEIPISHSDSSQFHIYSKTKEESSNIRTMLREYDAKYIVVESKSL